MVKKDIVGVRKHPHESLPSNGGKNGYGILS